MAMRPVFVPAVSGAPWVSTQMVEFRWNPGLSAAQKRRNVVALHDGARREGLEPLLEISSKSQEERGIALSAFHLGLAGPDGRPRPVEVHYQFGKRFRGGVRLPAATLDLSPREIRKEVAGLGEGLALEAFVDPDGREWALTPETAFYDWLYLGALRQNPDLSAGILDRAGFTDIEFNPQRQVSCQARAAAIFVAFSRAGRLEEALAGPEAFLRVTSGGRPAQPGNFGWL